MHREFHRTEHIGWLRASVLGANDGLYFNQQSCGRRRRRQSRSGAILIAALAGLVAGSLSMAAGEYVSVSSQSDTERADLAREREELATSPENELAELTGIYEARGLTRELAAQVADQLTAHDALGAHARDELGMHEATRARPLQAALSSAAAFAVGAALPLLLALFWPVTTLAPAVMASSLILLALLGGVAARLGGAPIVAGAARVAFWGAVAMGATALVGRLFGTVV